MLTKSLSTWLLQRFALLTALLIACFSENATAQTRPFINISTRAEVFGGQNIIVAGFIIQTTATTTKQVLIRGMGPSYGLSLADPTITLHDSNGGVIHSNNDWKETQQNEIAATGMQPGNDLESAILWTLPAGSYTVTLGSGNGGTGIGLVELYDMGGAAPIVNLSSRAQVGTGDNALIGGVYIGDNTRAVVRAIGPTLGNYGIQGALQNPMLELYNGQGTLVASNDDWGTDGAAAEIQRIGLQPPNGNESAILPTLAPGPYTVIVRGVYNTTGIGMVELYALEDAAYPRVFQDWGDADNLNEDRMVTAARHDVFWSSHNGFGWYWVDANGSPWTGDYESETFAYNGAQFYDIATLRSLNPKIKILCSIEHYGASLRSDPNASDPNLRDDSPWWKLQNGQRIPSPFGGGQYLLDQDNPALQDHVANQARVVMQTGQFDGVMLDVCFINTSYLPTLLAKVRSAIGENGLIIVNVNANKLTPGELNKINGVLMESGSLTTSAQWENVKSAVNWNEYYTRTPRVNCLETSYVNSRNDLNLMRATTCLGLTHSNGCVLFADPNSLPTLDHLHNWYPFWSDHSLGVPIVTTGQLWYPVSTYGDRRDFQNGSAVYNQQGNPTITVTFPEMRTSLATGVRSTSFTLPGNDGGIYIK
jgi:hypothetical protein